MSRAIPVKKVEEIARRIQEEKRKRALQSARDRQPTQQHCQGPFWPRANGIALRRAYEMLKELDGKREESKDVAA